MLITPLPAYCRAQNLMVKRMYISPNNYALGESVVGDRNNERSISPEPSSSGLNKHSELESFAQKNS